MRIQYLSDVHLEFAALAFPATDADVLVAAGDIGVGTQGAAWLAAAPQPVVYVAGNHESYGHALGDTLGALGAISALDGRRGGALHFLENAAVVIDGVRFLGATLWTPLGEGDEETCAQMEDLMNDYVEIGLGERRLRAQDTIGFHHASRGWLGETLATPHAGPTVVVTHHAPSFRSWTRDPTDAIRLAYASDLEALIARHRVDLWIHGHIHVVQDYLVGATRVVCNPRGYAPHWLVPGFDPQRIVEVGGSA